MQIEFCLIAGCMFGMEYVEDPEDDDQCVVIDIGCFRFLVIW